MIYYYILLHHLDTHPTYNSRITQLMTHLEPTHTRHITQLTHLHKVLQIGYRNKS